MPSVPLIAVIDDEDAVRKALQRLLRAAGMSVQTFSGGAEFLRSLARHRPDCAVLDLHMPDVTGFDVLARLAETRAGVPVVVITGNDSSETEASALGRGALAFLRKPIGDRLLLATISAAMARDASSNPPQS